MKPPAIVDREFGRSNGHESMRVSLGRKKGYLLPHGILDRSRSSTVCFPQRCGLGMQLCLPFAPLMSVGFRV